MAVEAGIDLQAGQEQESFPREVAPEPEMACVFGREPDPLLGYDEGERTGRNRQRPLVGDADLRRRLGLHALSQLLDVEAPGHDRAISEAEVVARRLELLVPERLDRDGAGRDRF